MPPEALETPPKLIQAAERFPIGARVRFTDCDNEVTATVIHYDDEHYAADVFDRYQGCVQFKAYDDYDVYVVVKTDAGQITDREEYHLTVISYPVNCLLCDSLFTLDSDYICEDCRNDR